MTPDGDERRIHIPRDVSLYDLWKNTPARYLITLGTLFLTAFGLGVSADRLILDHGRSVSSSAETEAKGGSGAPAQPTPVPPNAEVQSHEAPRDPREALRKSDDVTLIDATQNEAPIADIPYGRYGYVIPSTVESFIKKQSDKIPLFFSSSPKWFELHKIREGEFIIGFLSKEDSVAFDNPTHQRKDYNLFSNAYNNNSTPVKIPLANIEKWKGRYLPAGSDPTIAEITLQSPSSHR